MVRYSHSCRFLLFDSDIILFLVAPVVGYLTSEACSSTQGLYEVSGGWVAALRYEKTRGYRVSLFSLSIFLVMLIYFSFALVP